MVAFFEDGRDIGERDVLTEVAAGVGMRGRDVRKAIGSDQVRQVVVAREAQVRSSGLNAAPGFLLNRRLLVVGAQPTEAIVNGSFETGDFTALPYTHAGPVSWTVGTDEAITVMLSILIGGKNGHQSSGSAIAHNTPTRTAPAKVAKRAGEALESEMPAIEANRSVIVPVTLSSMRASRSLGTAFSIRIRPIS